MTNPMADPFLVYLAAQLEADVGGREGKWRERRPGRVASDLLKERQERD